MDHIQQQFRTKQTTMNQPQQDTQLNMLRTAASYRFLGLIPCPNDIQTVEQSNMNKTQIGYYHSKKILMDFKLTSKQATNFKSKQATPNIINWTFFGFKLNTKHVDTQMVVLRSSFERDMYFIQPNNIQLYLWKTTQLIQLQPLACMDRKFHQWERISNSLIMALFSKIDSSGNQPNNFLYISLSKSKSHKKMQNRINNHKGSSFRHKDSKVVQP